MPPSEGTTEPARSRGRARTPLPQVPGPSRTRAPGVTRWPRWAVDTHRVSRGSRCACFVLRGSRHGKRELPLSLAPGRGGPRGTTDCDVWGRVRLSRRGEGTLLPSGGGAGTLQTPSAWDGPPRVPRPGMREPKEAPPPPSLPGRLELEFDPLRAPSRIQSPTLC